MDYEIEIRGPDVEQDREVKIKYMNEEWGKANKIGRRPVYQKSPNSLEDDIQVCSELVEQIQNAIDSEDPSEKYFNKLQTLNRHVLRRALNINQDENKTYGEVIDTIKQKVRETARRWTKVTKHTVMLT